MQGHHLRRGEQHRVVGPAQEHLEADVEARGIGCDGSVGLFLDRDRPEAVRLQDRCQAWLGREVLP